jgi:leader peptidase (prepilin peptidase)/N-methyltransferase
MAADPLTAWIPAAAAVFGLILGSAVTALAHRVPRGISWVSERSACPACGHRLGPADLVPLLSWLAMLGHCRHCRARVPVRYPVTELACATWAVLLVRHVGPGLEYLPLALWGFLLIALMWIDLDFQLLPDVLTFPGTLVALAAVLPQPGGAAHALWGVVTGSGLLWLLAVGYHAIRKVEGMGGGDIKLAAMFGAVLGWKLTLLTLFLAALAGSLWGLALIALGRGHGRTALPFGTLLAPAALIAFLWGEGWFRAYFEMIFGR